MRSFSRNQFVVDADVAKVHTRKLDQVTIVLCIEPCLHNVDDPDRPNFPRPRFEQLFFAGPNCPVFQLLFDDIEPFADLFFVNAGAIAAKQNSTT